MKKMIVLSIFVFLAIANASAQYYTNQNKIWAFGDHAGVNFNTGSPIPISTSMNTTEGCASVCNAAGTLLFYTDGKTVYNASGSVMPNGASIVSYSTFSAAQGALIVPVIGNSNQYYVFSLGHYGTAGDMNYSIVDMTLDGGNGDVMTSAMGVSMGTGFSEAMTAVAGNSCNIWVLAHRKDSGTFWAYNVTTAGIGSPVISSAGSISGANSYGLSTINVSPDRQRIATQVYAGGHVTELQDFNPTTGIVSNCQVLEPTTAQYSAAFSPDNTKLYAGQYGAGNIAQYDVSLTTTSAIIASKTIVASPGSVGHLKLGPDNKIYVSLYATGFLDCITSPNTTGSGCGYSSHAVTTASGTTARLGLPNIFISVNPNDTVLTHHDTVACIATGGSITLTAHDSGAIGCGYMWYDGTTTTRTKSVTAAGNYWVKIFDGCRMTVDTIHLTTYPSLGPITGTASACPGGTSTLSDTSAGGTWSSSSTTTATIGSSTGIVAAVATGVTTITYTAPTGCYITRGFTVNPLPGLTTGTLTVCVGGTTTLSNPSVGGTWTSGSPSVATIGSLSGSVLGISAGTAVITYTMPTGCFRTTTVTVNPLPPAITGTLSMCVGATSLLSNASPGGTWSSSVPAIATVGSSGGLVSGLMAGNTTITYTLPSGCFITATATINPTPSPVSGVFTVCMGATTTLYPFPTGGIWISMSPAIATVGSSTGVVTGITVGTSVISYTLPTGCATSRAITVDAVPAPITGSLSLCVGTTTTLGDATAGGSWTCSDYAIAYVDPASGLTTGISIGPAVITYSLPSGCFTTTMITVNPFPTAITGLSSVCVGSTATLYNGFSGGTWSSGATAIATIDALTGVYTGVSAGSAIMTYSMGAGCFTTFPVTIYPVPLPITGTASVCPGMTTTLSDATTGGTWSSAGTSIATVGSGTGIVTGVSSGVVTISYSFGSGITCSTTRIVTVNPLPLPVSGSLSLCPGGTSALTSTSGGTWTSGATGIATIGSSSGIVSGVTIGTAPISYTLPTGCFRIVTVTVNPGPSGITGPSNICIGLSITLSSSTPGGTWSRSNTNVTIGSTTGVVTGAAFGTTTITYTVPSGCFATKVVTINSSPAPITGGPGTCIGSAIPLSSATPGGTWTSGATGIATIGSSSGVLTGVAAGPVSITYAVGTGCTTSAVITVNPLPLPIAGPPAVCQGSTITLTNPTTGGIWSSGSPAIATIGSLTGTVSGVAAGTVTISYTAATGCIRTTTITVNPLPAPISGPSALCVGATMTETGGTGGTWASSTPTIATIGSASGIVTGIATGSAMITYISAAGCVATRIITVSVSPAPITGPATVCAGASVPFSDVVPGGSWISSSPATAAVGSLTGIVTGIGTGAATITYSLGTGCTVTRMISVTPSPAPIGGITSICAGATTTVSDITPGGTWSSGTTAIVTIGSTTGIIAGVATGTATISYTVSSTGCSAVVTITVNPTPVAITGPAAVCVGESVTETNATAGGDWSTSSTLITIGSATGIVSGITAGTAVVTYAIGATSTSPGCRVTRTITINPISPITGASGVCVASTITLSDIVPGGSWASSFPAIATVGATSGIVTGISSGTTTITYTLPTGCSATKTVTINTGPAPISGTRQVCVGGTTALSNTVGGGSWSSSNLTIATIGSLTGIVSGLASGTATITYSLGSGCIVTAPLTVNPNPAGITGSSVVCIGATTVLSNATVGGTFSSSTTTIATIGATTGIVTGIATGMATISYTLPTGCMAAKDITVNPAPAPISGTPNVCIGATTTLSNTVTGGTWTSGNVLVATVGSTSGIVNGIAAGTATITYAIGAGCMATKLVTVNPLPTPITGTASVCVGAITTLSNAVPGGVWTSSSTTIATIGSSTGVVTGISVGTATITYTPGAGCSVTRIVTVNPIPGAITGTATICVGMTTALSNPVPGGTWISSNPVVAGIGSATGVVTGVNTGTSTITYTSPAGCRITGIVTVSPAPPGITGSTSVCAGMTITLSNTAPGGVWTSGNTARATVGSTTGIVTGISGGSVTISYTIPSGCVATRVVNVTEVPPITGLHNLCAWGDTLTVSDSNTTGLYSSTLATVLNLGLGRGRITTHAPGVATISYLLPGGCYRTATFTVNPLPAPITGTIRLCPGGTTTLSNLAPGGVWTSSAPSVATIGSSSGMVSGVSVGSSNITYRMPATGCMTDTTVFVDPPPSPIMVMSTTVIVGATNMFMHATPGGTWSSSAPSIATVGSSSGIVTGISLGTATISYRLPGVGCPATRAVTVVSAPSIHPGEGSISISPNPTRGTFTVTGTFSTRVSPMGNASGEEEVWLEVSDMLGQAVYQDKVTVRNGNLDEQITLNGNLANGMYILSLRSASERRLFHVVLSQ